MTSRMDRLFGSKTRVSLLAKIAMNPDKSYYIRELSRELKIPYGMVYKEVKNLASLGVVKEEKRGKVVLVSVNKNLPFFAELKSLMVKTVGLADLIRMALLDMNGIRYALVYGSFACGDESMSSDVDLLIMGDIEEEKLLNVLGRAEKEVELSLIHISEPTRPY